MDIEHEQAERILIVDDEDSLRLTFEMLLKRAGYSHVTGVSGYDEAVTAIEQNNFDLIISDIVLPGTSGIDLLRHVKETGKTCPVVMITGYPNIESAAEAVRLGAFDYVPKPVKKNELLKIVALALEKYELQKEKVRFEAQQEKNRQMQETILRSVREIIITVDTHLRIADMNDMAKDWARTFLPDITIGVPLPTLTSRFGRALLEDAEEVLKHRKELRLHRIEWQKPDKSTGVMSVTAVPLEDSRSNFLGVVITARDLTNLEDIDRREQRANFHRFIGKSKTMQRIYALLESVGKVDTTVLVTGESGTGKELVADALHNESPRSNRPLVKVDCTAIPEDLLESELFGHKKGSFTGADRDRLGRILQADGGTLFLDEIGDISPRMQLRLLRFLQERTFYPVGQDQPIQVDVRVITATNADLKEKVNRGQFREDLYFRLRVVDIHLPPLRERKEDIPLLARHFLTIFDGKMKKGITGFSDPVLEQLARHSWPGNIRELEHIIERAYVLCNSDTITTEHLPTEVKVAAVSGQPGAIPAAAQPAAAAAGGPESDPEDEVGRIIEALRRTGGNKAKAARLLGFDRSTLYRKIASNNIDLSDLKI
ncbi:MAG: sigma 54-interacting transcriptional regulator [Deltaproteobacteria bacterium]|jgi:DNA-binding NtrC family response regulator|nr:sigma 54-interacting transcriptional regulator [Deltaproteobacteria bacterium]MBW2522293.1 sigma 54-interacting transcriptional regulator [Deltaproteobacteria bacterium]